MFMHTILVIKVYPDSMALALFILHCLLNKQQYINCEEMIQSNHFDSDFPLNSMISIIYQFPPR